MSLLIEELGRDKSHLKKQWEILSIFEWILGGAPHSSAPYNKMDFTLDQ